MKLRLPLTLTAILTIAISNLNFYSLTLAGSTFTEEEVEQTQFIAVASPFGKNQYNLLVIEQIPDKKEKCWSESGSNPVLVDPLLLKFDFTGICRRSTDSNGYSIRINGQDYGLNYLLRIVERNGELELVGKNRSDINQPEILIGKTYGMGSGVLKIILEPGWRFTKRSFDGKILGHVYFSKTDVPVTNPETPPDSNSGSGENVPVIPPPPGKIIQQKMF